MPYKSMNTRTIAIPINLKTVVGREKEVSAIGELGECEKRVVTLLMMSAFLDFPGAPRGGTDFRDPSAVFSINKPPIHE